MDARSDGGNRQWIWRQVWRDVLFLHWRVNAGAIAPHVPPALTIDTLDGDAWVSLVLFRLQVTPVGWPIVPGFSSLVEANLRTYVRLGDEPGIYFFSIHADNLVALTLARLLTPLPYRWADVEYELRHPNGRCRLKRTTSPACELRLTAELGHSRAALVDDRQPIWLLERYRAFATRSESLQTATVSHAPWCVQPAAARIEVNSLGNALGVDLSGPPDDAHYCPEMYARFSQFVKCEIPQATKAAQYAAA